MVRERDEWRCANTICIRCSTHIRPPRLTVTPACPICGQAGLGSNRININGRNEYYCNNPAHRTFSYTTIYGQPLNMVEIIRQRDRLADRLANHYFPCTDCGRQLQFSEETHDYRCTTSINSNCNYHNRPQYNNLGQFLM
jgi:DNA-directed RNA polymerase subunit RPC12/RpoP